MTKWPITSLSALMLIVPLSADARDQAPAMADPPALLIEADYSASVLIFPVGRVALNAEIDETRYRADAHVEAAGLAALFTDFEIDSRVEGQRLPAGPRPTSYAHIERTGDKRRDIDVRFDSNIADATAQPDFSSWGQPPASEQDRTGVVDPMTAILQLSEIVLANNDTPCQGVIPVFDGKQRYDLRLSARGMERVRTRAWRGEALVCDAFYEPISGYDPEDWPTPGETRHPLTIWIAPIADGTAFLPVRLHTRAGFGGVTVELRTLTLH